MTGNSKLYIYCSSNLKGNVRFMFQNIDKRFCAIFIHTNIVFYNKYSFFIYEEYQIIMFPILWNLYVVNKIV